MMRSTLPVLIALMAANAGFSGPLTLSSVSPDKKRELVITHATGETMPHLLLRDTKNHKVIDSMSLDIDESDYRESIDALWSPSSRFVAVNEHLGQLYSFAVYDISHGRLRAVAEVPIPKKFIEEYFTPGSTKSRGGQQVQCWLDELTFIVGDTMYYVPITYRVTSKRKLEVVNVKPQPQ
jgi:hypothetical protein